MIACGPRKFHLLEFKHLLGLCHTHRRCLRPHEGRWREGAADAERFASLVEGGTSRAGSRRGGALKHLRQG